ncbi:MAG TPA: hypothetical protein VG796_25430 [Verrucomicrobiales bacterium]|nr:hypothetical protein [Verrucomicrobiales bacterium]
MLRSRPADQTADAPEASKEKPHGVDARPETAALTAPGRRVLAWLSIGLPAPDHFMEMPELSLEDLKNVEALSSTDFPVLLSHASDFRRQRLLLERWAEVDAKALAAWLEPKARLCDPVAMIWSSGFRPPGSPVFHAGVGALNRIDPEAAKALNLKGGGHTLIFFPLGDVAPDVKIHPAPPPPPPDPDFIAMSGADAWKWLKERGRTSDLREIAGRLIQSDPARAVTWLEEMPLTYERAPLVRDALLAATRGNPDFLLAALGKFAAPDDLKYALQNCRNLNRSHSPGIEAWTRQCNDPGMRRTAIQWLAERRARDKPEDAMEWINQLPQDADRSAAMDSLAPRWPDPAEMARRIAGGGILPDNSKALAILTARWAEKDRTAAQAWAQSLPPGPLRSQAVGGVWSAWAQTEPEAALAATAALTGIDRRAGTQAVASSLWAQQYPGKALQWIATLPATDQTSALAATSTEFPNTLNSEALSTLTRVAGASVPSDDAPAFLRFVRSAISREIHRDADATARWAISLPQGDVRREALSAIAEHMLSASWEKGSAWVASLPAADQAALRQ